jgi:hypothetical protein
MGLLPPVYVVLIRRRTNSYRKLVAQQMDPQELASMAHLRDVAAAWICVATGASLIAVTATWTLHEAYGWPTWAFWVTLAIMIGILPTRMAQGAIRPDVPPTGPTGKTDRSL